MKTQTKEEVIQDLVKYVDIEGMNSVEAEVFCEEIHDALFEYFNPEEEDEE